MRENQRVEFKESWRDEYLKTLCAIINTEDVVMYLEMSDSAEPIGFKNTERV